MWHVRGYGGGSTPHLRNPEGEGEFSRLYEGEQFSPENFGKNFRKNVQKASQENFPKKKFQKKIAQNFHEIFCAKRKILGGNFSFSIKRPLFRINGSTKKNSGKKFSKIGKTPLLRICFGVKKILGENFGII